MWLLCGCCCGVVLSRGAPQVSAGASQGPVIVLQEQYKGKPFKIILTVSPERPRPLLHLSRNAIGWWNPARALIGRPP